MARTGVIPLSTTEEFFDKKGPGSLYDQSDFNANTKIADGGKATQTATITVSTNTNGATYEFAVNGIALTATGGSTATLTGDAIVAAIEADALANAAVLASNASGTVTLTSRAQSQTFTVTSDDTKLTVAAGTTASDGNDITLGGAVLLTTSGAAEVAASLLTARAVVLTPTAANSTLYQVFITMNPGCGTAEVTYPAQYTSDGSATVKEIVEGLTAAINAIMPANTVVATEDDATMTLTAEVAGLDFNVGFNANISAGSYSGTTLADTFLGIASSDDLSIIPVGTSDSQRKIKGGSSFTVYTEGRVVVATNGTVTPGRGNPVCVRVSGSTASFSSTPSSTYIPLPQRLARWFPAPELATSTTAVAQLSVQ